MLALNSSIDYLLGGLQDMKITKRTKGIILAGVFVIMIGAAVVTSGVGGFSSTSPTSTSVARIDPPGD
jgi:hypothetical protein